jgi:hypothetical protein
VATGSGAGQHIAETFGRQQCIEFDDLHRLPLTGQPTGEQAPITQRQWLGQLEPLPKERQPALDAIALTPGFKAGHFHQLLERGFAVAEGGEIHHVLELISLKRKRHPETPVGCVLEGIAVVVGKQNLGGHGGEESLHRFWL